MNLRRIFVLVTILMTLSAQYHAQDKGNENSIDNTLHGESRVNPSTLGMEFELPLANFPGRGINVPVTLNYSSKIWRLDYVQLAPDPGAPTGRCRRQYSPVFSDKSASGWTTSLATPYIEYVGGRNFYDSVGQPVAVADAECGDGTQTVPSDFYYIRRVVVHLPSGETHELRADDTPLIFHRDDPNDPRNPNQALNWDGTYYAVDGSNLRLTQNIGTGTYRLYQPDGTFYDFAPGGATLDDRKAIRFTDRHGNATNYRGPDGTYPFGSWTDSLGRTIPVPFAPSAPTAPTSAANPQLYFLPGNESPFKLHWKRLKADTLAESALTDFSQPLRFDADSYVCGTPARFCQTPPANALFTSDDARIVRHGLFNPVVLTQIDLPGGQSYKFSYDVYGRIERIKLPTGGYESLTYSVVPALNTLDSPDGAAAQTNFGVTQRRLFDSGTDDQPYVWNFTAQHVPEGYLVASRDPDGVRTERVLHRGNPAINDAGAFGVDDLLAGMPLEERVFSTLNRLVSKTYTAWQTTATNAGFQWHPRITERETQFYADDGTGIASTSTFEYAGDLNRPDTLLLVKRKTDYGFVVAGQVRTATPVRQTETSFIADDETVSPAVRSALLAKNMGGLPTSTVLRDGAGTIVSKTVQVYDEPGFSPATGLGNLTSVRSWNSSNGLVGDSSAYSVTRSRYDEFGNEVESIDARGAVTTTTYDDVFRAFPVKVTTPVADPTGLKASNTAAVTTATFDTVRGLPLTKTDANGVETRYSYEPRTLRPIRTERFKDGTSVGGATETIYNDVPDNYSVRTRTQIDTNIWTESTTFFDGLGRAVKTVKPTRNGNVVVEKEFDAAGREKRVTNPYFEGAPKFWTSFAYDEAGRLTETTQPDGSKIRTRTGVLITDLVGSTTTVTDQAGKKRVGVYDALGRMVRVIEDPAGENLATDYKYDAAGNIRRITQGVQSRFFAYDSLGRLTYTKLPEQDANAALQFVDPVSGNSQWSSRNEYDAAGNVIRTTDARNVVATNSYDNLNRLTFTDYSDSTPDVGFYYDGRFVAADNSPRVASGAVIGTKTGNMSTGNRSFATEFDNVGRVTKSQQQTDGQVFNFEYRYNLTGLIAETYPSGRTVAYDLDADGELARISGQTQNASKTYANAFGYNADGEIEQIRLGNGKWESASYSARGQVTDLRLGSSVGDTSLLRLEFGYGATGENNGSLRSQKISFRGIAAPFEQHYSYDGLNRVSSADETVGTSTVWRQTFSYDRYGNRTIGAGSSLLSLGTQKVVNPSALESDNRFRRDQDNDGRTDYQYDAAGSIIADAENKRYAYDAESRVREFFAASNSGAAPDMRYFYDGHGRRVKKVSADDSTIFVYDAFGKLAAEYSTTPSATPATSYLTADPLGSARVITDGTGSVSARRDFGAFGEELYTGNRTSAAGYRSSDIRQHYTGYERDSESGLEFAQARYYSANQGRFTSVDPLGESANLINPQTLNRYTYALNSPYKFTDPLGLAPVGGTSRASGGGHPPKKKKAKRSERTSQTSRSPAPLQPNPNIVVPANVRAAAAETTLTGTLTSSDGTSSEQVTIQRPASMVAIREELANFAYTQQGAATTQAVANRITGPVVPESATVSTTTETRSDTSTSNQLSGGVEISTTPSVSVGGSTTNTTQVGTTGSQNIQVTGPSTSTAAAIANIETQTNLAITNYLNSAADVRGDIIVTSTDSKGRKSTARWSRESVRRDLVDFVRRVRQTADADFGGL